MSIYTLELWKFDGLPFHFVHAFWVLKNPAGLIVAEFHGFGYYEKSDVLKSTVFSSGAFSNDPASVKVDSFKIVGDDIQRTFTNPDGTTASVTGPRQLIEDFDAFHQELNAANVGYELGSRNSNAVASGYAARAGQRIQDVADEHFSGGLVKSAVGWDTSLEDPDSLPPPEEPGSHPGDVLKCFAAGTPVRMADGTEKPIEQIAAGEWVMAFDPEADHGRGKLVASLVTRTMVNHGQLLLDFYGTMVTPGHVFLTGDEHSDGKGVFKRLIDILIEDGTVVNAEGVVLRAATNFPVGSVEDRFVEIVEIWPENGTIGSRPARLRAGTLLIGDDGTATTLLDCLTREGFELLPDGRVSHRGGPSQPMLMQAPVPRPETYVLKRSGLTLEQIHAHASLRDVAPAAMAARALRQPRADVSAPASVGMQVSPADTGGGWPQGWTPSADNGDGLTQRPVLPKGNRTARRRAEAQARKQSKRKLH